MGWLLREMLCAGAILALHLEGQATTKSAGDVQEGLKITVLFFNYAPVDEVVMEKARKQITRVFRKAGVELGWAGCPTQEGTLPDYPRCTGFHDPTHYSLHILPHAGKEMKQEVAGEALSASRIVNVFWDCVQEQAIRYRVPLPEMLAAIISHEFGHLLLGPNSHTPLGIMVGRWTPRVLISVSQGGLGFTSEQQELIRAELRKHHAR